MRIAKLSAQNLIDTFGDNDFFNVVYVSTLCITLNCGYNYVFLFQFYKFA